MTIDPFDPDKYDIAALAALHAIAFPDGWTAKAILDLLANPGTFCFLETEPSDCLAGFVMARVAGDEAEILTIAVRPEARGKGLGRALIQAAAARAVLLGAETVFLEVGDNNPPALALYAGLGFVRVGRRPGYYQGYYGAQGSHAGAQDATVMKSPLPLPKLSDFA